LNNLKVDITASDVLDMNLREEAVHKTGPRRSLSSYAKQHRNAFEIECHRFESNIDTKFEGCIESWNSTLTKEGEIELAINFTDPLLIS
jgi:hypothetical protein